MPANDDAPKIYCSLNDEEFRTRRTIARKALLPHLLETRSMERGLKLTFANSDALRAEVEEFVALERQCCSVLTFTVSPPGDGLVVTIEGPREAAATINLFAEALATTP